MLCGKIGNKKGIAMPIVIILVMIIMLLGVTAAFVAESQTTAVTRTTNRESALYYAEAGYNAYLWHLNDDYNFFNTTASNTILNVDTAFEKGYYNLSIIPPTGADPIVTIRSTGWTSNDQTNRRSIEVKIFKREFVQEVYGSNVEETEGGSNNWWLKGDIVNGPLHTNGTLNIDGTVGVKNATGPIFNGAVTYTAGINKKQGTTQFNGGEPKQVTKVVYPESNTNVIPWAQKDGYYYKGRTCIYINGNQVVIRNKTGGSETRALPPNGVIYVDSDKNAGSNSFDINQGNVFVSGTLNGRLTIAAKNNIYITAYNPTNWAKPGGYKDDPIISGYTGGLFYADTSENTDDMLGLMANNYVKILHWNWPNSDNDTNYQWYYSNFWGTEYDVAPNDITIYAAIIALKKAFIFEDYGNTSGGYHDIKGAINLYGSSTTHFAAVFGVFSGRTIISGYNSHFNHDVRMSYLTPPHFLEPANSGWEVRSWKEIANP